LQRLDFRSVKYQPHFIFFKDKIIGEAVTKKIDDASIKIMQFNKAENMIVLSFSGIKDKKIESGIKLLYETIAN